MCSIVCDYIKKQQLTHKNEEQKSPHITHPEGPKSHHRRRIADGCRNFTFAKVKNNIKNTFVKVNFCVSLHFEKVNQYDARGLSTA